jgi:S-methylmethionine-dependent homocysteine/selenocysteine methylase
MIKHTPFPPQKEGRFYLTEGGTETELMYKHGFELPYFAMFPLLDNPKAVSKMREMFRSYLDVAARHRFCALMGGLDYRASPDWGELLGYSAASLADANLQSIEFLRELASEYSSQIPEILIQGLIGPRGDAYERNETITADEAEDYHAVQLETLKGAHVDSALAITFNNIPESVGVARAAAKIGVPLGISLTLDSNSKLHSGPSLAEAIAMIDQETDQSPEYYLINCSHPVEFLPALELGDWVKRVRGVRPNASRMEKIALCQIGHLEDGDPEELGSLCGDLARRYPHMDIWGGCCGTWDNHLNEIAKNVQVA